MNSPIVKGKFIKTNYVISTFENKIGIFDMRKPSIILSKAILT